MTIDEHRVATIEELWTEYKSGAGSDLLVTVSSCTTHRS